MVILTIITFFLTLMGEEHVSEPSAGLHVEKKETKKEEDGGSSSDPGFSEDLLGRLEWWFLQRLFPAVKNFKLHDVNETILSQFNEMRVRAIKHKRQMNRYSPGIEPGNVPPVPNLCNWISVGPRNINGRIRSLAIHPTQGNMIYAGAADGGVWKSTDSGQSWYPLMQYENSLSIGALAIDPVNPNTLYAGTGEPTWWPGYEGIGVLKSTDGGNTWALTGPIGNGHIARITVDPVNTHIVYCAGFPGGLYRTDNGGTSWTQIRAGDVTDFALNPLSPNILYAGVRDDGVYKSTNRGATWFKLAGGLPTSVRFRVMLSLCAASPNTVYAKLDETVYKSTDNGSTWTSLGNHGGETYQYWCNYVAVDPTDPNIVFAAGINLEKSTNGGTTWTGRNGLGDIEKTALHADQHAMVFAPENHQKIYAANDGGVYLSTDGANTWKKVSDGLIVSQFYGLGTSPATPSRLAGGMQDQGVSITGGSLTWHRIVPGDGGILTFDPINPYTVFTETQNNNLLKSTDGGFSWIGATRGLTGIGPWIGAIALDSTSPNILFTGRQKVFRTIDGATTWSESSPLVGGNVSAIAIAPSNHQVVYVGTSTGKIWKSTDGGKTSANWSDVTKRLLPTRFVSDLLVDRRDPNIVVATFSGFNSFTPTTPGHVFRSSDGGGTWTNISGMNPNDLPDIPVNAIEIDKNDPNTLYLGTDAGAFRSTDLGAGWEIFEPGLPNTSIITDLELDENQHILNAATHGRGIWQIKVNGNCPSADIYVRDNCLDTGQEPSPDDVVNPLSVVQGGQKGDRVYHWECVDIKVDAPPFDAPDALLDGVEFDRDLISEHPVQNQVNHVYVQVHNRGPFKATNVKVKIWWTEATPTLPSFPNDFWSKYPNDSIDTTRWHPIGTYQTIPNLEPERPVVLFWDWVPPDSANRCILVVIDSTDNPIPENHKILAPDAAIRNDKRVGLKRL